MLDEKNKYNKNHLSQYIIQLKLNNYTDFKFQGDREKNLYLMIKISPINLQGT